MIEALLRLLWPVRLDISWLTETLAVGAGPTSRGCRELRRLGVTTIVDLRTEAERERDPRWESAIEAAGLELRSLPVRDGRPPTLEELDQGTSWVMESMGTGGRVLICCRVGAQRSATLATAVLVRMGYHVSDAFSLVSASRRAANPTDQQVAILRAFAEHVAAQRHTHGPRSPRPGQP